MPRKKLAEFDEESEETFEWDKPRIIIFFIVLVGLIIGGLLVKHFVLDAQTAPQGLSQAVQGISTSASDNSSQLPSVQDVKQGAQLQIVALEKKASQISVQDIATSSPQVKSLLQQLQQLPKMPGNIAKQACMNICNSL